MKDLVAIILAAGKGSRMKSDLPKVLHKVGGKIMVNGVLDIVRSVGVRRTIVVIGHKSTLVKSYLNGVETVEQKELLGTAHAVYQAYKRLKDFEGDVLVLYGDIPLLTSSTLKRLIDKHKESEASCTLLTTNLKDPTGYGRIIRDSAGKIVGIVEERSASQSEKAIKEINVGTYCFRSRDLFQTLEKIRPNKEKGEYYLTDAISILKMEKLKIESVLTDNPKEVLGVNTIEDLNKAHKFVEKTECGNRTTEDRKI